MGAIGMTTQNHPISIAEELQHTLRGIHGERLTVGAPEGLLAGVGGARGLELVFGRSDTGGFGFGEDGGGHDVEADVVLLAEDMVHGADGLHLSGMGEHLTTVDVADGVKPFAYLEVLIDICIALGAGFAACGHQDHVGIDVGDVFYGGLHLEGDALFLQVLTQAFSDVAIKGWQALFQVLDDGDLGAEAMEHAGELHADDACADDGEALGEGIEVKEACGIDYAGVVDAFNGEPFGFGACGNDDIGGSKLIDGMRINEFTDLPYQRDVRMGEDGLDTLTELRDDLCHTRTGLIEGGGVNVGLRGDAADIETGASHLRALEDRDLQALFGGVFSGAVTAWPRADDDQISLSHKNILKTE